MIKITANIFLNKNEIHEEFIHASGPGGQKVNKTASAVQLRFNLKKTSSLPEKMAKRIFLKLKNRLNAAGELIITARRFRSLERNRNDALARLIALLQKAAVEPKRRRSTRPTQAARERRLLNKRRLAERKQLRKKTHGL